MSLGPVVAVINRKGGTGKTTTAVTLAELATRTGTPATVLDLDPMAGAAIWSDLAAGVGDPIAAKVIQPPPDISPVQLPRWARSNLDGLVYIDVNPGDVPSHEAAVEIAADVGGLVIVPSPPASADIVQTINTLEALASSPAPVVALLVRVFTRTVRQREARAELVAAGADLLATEVAHRQEIEQQAGAGDFRADGLLFNLYAPVLDEIRGRLS